MNILADLDAAEPVGAVALLERGDRTALERFQRLEDRVWDATTLSAPVIEAVRIRGARIRGCAFCASVRMSGATDAGLSEEQLADQDTPERRAALPADQRAALRLVDAFLLEAKTPDHAERARLVDTLGATGVVEVLVACAVSASADLRIALGDNRPASRTVVPRTHARRTASSPARWPALAGSPLLAETPLPRVDDRIAVDLRGLRADLVAQRDIPAPLLSACIIRGAQLLGVPDSDAERLALTTPTPLRGDLDPTAVRAWTDRFADDDRAVMAFAEQLWTDPSGLDAHLVTPLRAALGDAALIRTTWRLIWIGQLQRLGLVLGAEATVTH